MKNDETKDYRVILDLLREKFFLAPDGKNIETLVQLVKHAVEIVTSGQGNGPLYPVNFGRHQISEVSDEAVIPLRISEDSMNLIGHLPIHMQGSVKASNPFMVKNIIQPTRLTFAVRRPILFIRRDLWRKNKSVHSNYIEISSLPIITVTQPWS